MKELAESRVLIVDDVRANVDVLVQALREDYKLSVALGGQQALDAVARTRPDLVLLDIVMPDVDGYEVCRRLRADESTREIYSFLCGVVSGLTFAGFNVVALLYVLQAPGVRGDLVKMRAALKQTWEALSA